MYSSTDNNKELPLWTQKFSFLSRCVAHFKDEELSPPTKSSNISFITQGGKVYIHTDESFTTTF